MLFEGTIKLPLNMEQLQKVLELKKQTQAEAVPLNLPAMGVISLKDSTLKDSHFINYVSNLRLSICIEQEDLPKEDKFEIYKSYLNSRMLSEIKDFNELTMCILLERKGVAFDGDLFLTKEERSEFSQLHDVLFVKYETFLESILIGLPFCIKDYAATIGKELIDSGKLKVITDPAYISSNIVSLIVEPDFLELYLSLPIKHEVAFFDSQWFEPVFNGYSLISIITINSSLFPFMQSMYEGWFTEEEIKAAS